MIFPLFISFPASTRTLTRRTRLSFVTHRRFGFLALCFFVLFRTFRRKAVEDNERENEFLTSFLRGIGLSRGNNSFVSFVASTKEEEQTWKARLLFFDGAKKRHSKKKKMEVIISTEDDDVTVAPVAVPAVGAAAASSAPVA